MAVFKNIFTSQNKKLATLRQYTTFIPPRKAKGLRKSNLGIFRKLFFSNDEQKNPLRQGVTTEIDNTERNIIKKKKTTKKKEKVAYQMYLIG